VTQAVTDFLLDVASMLVDRYALRAFAAVQLAGYITLRGSAGTDVPFFVCADRALLLSGPAGRRPRFGPLFVTSLDEPTTRLRPVVAT
jgi:hypothetical protein